MTQALPPSPRRAAAAAATADRISRRVPRRLSRPTLLAAIAGLLLAGCHDQASGGGSGARDEIRIVGSSTVYPFTTTVAEQFVLADPRAPAPVIESTGTGAGLRLFCGGVGAAFPDIADASRRITAAEFRRCQANGAGALLEVVIGIDGIAVAQARGASPPELTPALLYRALAYAPGGRPNRAHRWSDLDPALPATPIRVYGPPATSGTRDALTALILAPGCRAAEPAAARLGPAGFAARCLRLREDGAYVDAGENDNLIVRKLRADPGVLGIFGYSYLEENRDTVEGVAISGVRPTYAAIAQGRYPGSRPLFLYVKRAHLAAVPGLRRFLALYAASWAPGGPLVRRGLIAAPPAVSARSAAVIAHEIVLDPAGLG